MKTKSYKYNMISDKSKKKKKRATKVIKKFNIRLKKDQY